MITGKFAMVMGRKGNREWGDRGRDSENRKKEGEVIKGTVRYHHHPR